MRKKQIKMKRKVNWEKKRKIKVNANNKVFKIYLVSHPSLTMTSPICMNLKSMSKYNDIN